MITPPGFVTPRQHGRGWPGIGAQARVSKILAKHRSRAIGEFDFPEPVEYLVPTGDHEGRHNKREPCGALSIILKVRRSLEAGRVDSEPAWSIVEVTRRFLISRSHLFWTAVSHSVIIFY